MDELVSLPSLARLSRVAVFVAAVAYAATSDSADQSTSPLEEALQQSIRMREISNVFGASHPATGLRALTYIHSLKKEGFACVARYVDQTSAGEGESLGRFSTTKVPIVDCARVPSGYDECARFRVSIIFDLDENGQSSLHRLVKQLSEVQIKDAYFVCEQTQQQNPRVLADDLKRGVAVRIE